MDDSATLPVQRQQLHARRAALVSANAREPRAAAASLLTGTVTVSESCEFYGAADSISRCREPRSCQDCLEMPGCGLTNSGSCKNVTSKADEFTNSPDYRTANFSVDSLISNTSWFVFKADTASYCAASDTVCTKCREQFQANAASKTSTVPTATQFCKGADGCVCIAICEVPIRRAARVLDWHCGQPYIRADPLPAISRGSNRTVRGDPRAPAVKLTQPPKDQESCEYTREVDLRGCQRPRTCQSCLETPACEIREGRCYDATSEYSASRDYHNATVDANNMSGASYYAFPSSNTTYCPASDATCAACRQQFLKRDVDGWRNLVLNFNTFCVGQDGCVCIELCESQLWSTGVEDTECNRMYGGDKFPSPAGLLAAATAAWLALWGAYKFTVFTRRRHVQERRRHNARQHQNLWRNMLDEVPDLPFLDLFGWRAYREQAYEREQDELGGREVSRVWHPVDFENTDPTAPEFDECESSAPTAQDPKALASAPIYRNSFHDRDSSSEGTGSSTNDTDHSSPSAPDFADEEDTEWEPRLSHTGLVARRSRRGELYYLSLRSGECLSQDVHFAPSHRETLRHRHFMLLLHLSSMTMSATAASLARNDKTPLALLLTKRRTPSSPVDARTRDPRSASYCDADDAVCTTCRNAFKRLSHSSESAKTLKTQFCVGDGGCVCIGVCEVPEVWAARVYDDNCSQPTPATRIEESRRLQAFTSTSRDPRAPLVNALDRRTTEQSRALTSEQDLQGCRRPRTCRECLAKPNCAIVGAQCVGMDAYNASKDYRITMLNSTNNTNVFHMGSAQFASVNATYCSQSDPVCATCGDAFRRSIVSKYTWDHLVLDSDFCVGANGCVCLEACDSILRSTGVFDTSCSKITRNTMNTETIFTQLAIAVGVWCVCLLLYGQLGQEEEPEEQDDEPLKLRRNMLDAAPAAGRLDLFGWRAFYDRLLEKGQELLLGVGNSELISPVTLPIDFLDMATAPDFDDDDSSAPTANDPRALASAPVFRALREDDNEEELSMNQLMSEPSAPDFDMDDAAWLNESRRNSQGGPFMQRSRRRD